MDKLCNICSNKTIFLKNFGKFPIVNNLLSSDIENNSEFYDFNLCVCDMCGLLQLNSVIEPTNFYTHYNTPSKEKNNPHKNTLLEKINKNVKKDSKIIEIGCNDGTFLDDLYELGFKNIFGLEPTVNMYNDAVAKGHRVKNCFLDSKEVASVTSEGLYDVVILRQVLEHVENLEDFGHSLNKLLDSDGLLIIEVPNSQHNLLNYDFSLWEEHVNYFTYDTLNLFMKKNEFEIIDSWMSTFAGECLSIVGKKNRSDKNSIKLKNDFQKWQKWVGSFEKFQQLINSELDILSEGKKVVLYGVGARSSTFVNFMGIATKLFLAIDDSKLKQNKFMPFSLTRIVPPQELEVEPESLFVLLGVNSENEQYCIESKKVLKNNNFISILPPSKFLPNSWKNFIKNYPIS